jgi:hypothetical protein
VEVDAVTNRTRQPRAKRQPLPRPASQHGALRLPGERPDRFALGTVVGRTNPRSAALLDAVADERTR